VENSEKIHALRLQAFGAVVVICVQSGFGMFVNLFVAVPVHHPGSKPSNYFSGSAHSVAWAVVHGGAALYVHTLLGFFLAAMVMGLVARALIVGRRSLTTWVVLGALFTIGAGFNGASFLDYHKDVSSFIMTVLALAASLCFLVVVYLPSGPSPSSAVEPSRGPNAEAN
jgi:hypothetical protein